MRLLWGSSPVRPAVSLLESIIAVGILGVGLILVAAVFPAALSQHRATADLARADVMLGAAEAMLTSRLNADWLWVDSTLPADQDSPWYLLPTTNLRYQAATWDGMLAAAPPTYTPNSTTYANVINGITELDLANANPTVLLGLDTLSDRRAPYTAGVPWTPFTDKEFAEAANRLVWYGFYRRPATGSTQFAAAVCRQRRDQLFVEQNLAANDELMSLAPEAQNPYSKPTAFLSGMAVARRLPVPWRVSLGYRGGNRLFNTRTAPMLTGGPAATDGIPVGLLAPAGSKIMIHGAVHQEPSPGISLPRKVVPAGRVLTVASVYESTPSEIEITESIIDLPLFDDGTGSLVTFDVWVFPPALEGNGFYDSSPVIKWETPL